MIKKASELDSQKSKEILGMVVQSVGSDISQYVVAYGYFLKEGIFANKMHSYAVALANDHTHLVVIPLEISGHDAGKPIKIGKDNFKGSRKTLYGDTTIKYKEGKIKLTIPPFTQSNAMSMYQLPIIQEDQAAKINAFLENMKFQ